MFEEATRMQLDVPDRCRLQAMAEAVAAAAAAWEPAQLRGGVPPPPLASLQRQKQKRAGGKEEQQAARQPGANEEQQQQQPSDMPGSWGPPAPSAAPGWQPSAAFRPDGCPTAVTGAAGLVGWAQATGVRRIVMVGDSTIRQVGWLGQHGAGAAADEGRSTSMMASPLPHCAPRMLTTSLACSCSNASPLWRARSQSRWTSCLSATLTTRWAGRRARGRRAVACCRTRCGSATTHTPRSCAPTGRPCRRACSRRTRNAAATPRSRSDAALPAGMRSRELAVDLVVGTFK